MTGDSVGSALTLASVLRYHTIVVRYTGTPSSVRVQLEGSHDNSNWALLDDFDYSSSAVTARTAVASMAYVRANLVSHVGALTLTATIASS